MGTASDGRRLRGEWVGWKVIRLAGFGAFVAFVAALLVVREAYATWKETALGVGESLARLEDLTGSSYRVRLNGERLHVSSAMANGALDAVLDRFAATCEGPGVVREERGARGMVACFAPRTGAASTTGWIEKAARFAASGDVGAFGGLRYVMAERTAAGRVHVVTAWTDDALPIARMFPASGDAPGEDTEGASRPEGARRLLEAGVEGAPYAVRVYATTISAEETLARFDASMAALGWQPQPMVRRSEPRSRAFSKDGRDLLVFVDAVASAPGEHRHENDRSTAGAILSLVEMGRPRR